MGDLLRDPILYPNWVWLASTGLILVALITGASLLIAYRRSRVRETITLHSLSQVRRERYLRQLNEVYQGVLAGQLGSREAHLAMSALIRAAASERLKMNVESLSVWESEQLRERWPELVAALQWCQEPSFGLHEPTGADAEPWVLGGLAHAEAVVSR